MIIFDFPYLKCVSKLPGYQAIVKSFKKFLRQFKGYIVNAGISVKILS